MINILIEIAWKNEPLNDDKIFHFYVEPTFAFMPLADTFT